MNDMALKKIIGFILPPLTQHSTNEAVNHLRLMLVKFSVEGDISLKTNTVPMDSMFSWICLSSACHKNFPKDYPYSYRNIKLKMSTQIIEIGCFTVYL